MSLEKRIKKTEWVTSPVTNKHFTRGELYLMFDPRPFPSIEIPSDYSFITLDDNNELVACFLKEDISLGGQDWKLIKYPALYRSFISVPLSMKYYVFSSLWMILVLAQCSINFTGSIIQIICYTLDVILAIYAISQFFRKLNKMPFFKELENN